MLSLAYISVEGADPLEQIDAAARAGFDAVGLRALQPTGRPLAHPILGDPAKAAVITKWLGERSVSVLDLEVVTLLPGLDLDGALSFLDLAAQLGTREVQVVCEDPDLDRAADGIAALAEASAERGLATALEFMAFRTVDTLETALRVVSRGRARVLLDTLHFVRSGGTIASLAAAPPERLAYLQLCDASTEEAPDDLIREARCDRLYPGEGRLPLHSICAALPPGLPISIEVPRASMRGCSATQQADAAMRWTKRFFDASSLPDA